MFRFITLTNTWIDIITQWSIGFSISDWDFILVVAAVVIVIINVSASVDRPVINLIGIHWITTCTSVVGQICIYSIGFIKSKASLLSWLVIVDILGINYSLIVDVILVSVIDWLVDLYFGYLIDVFVILPILF